MNRRHPRPGTLIAAVSIGIAANTADGVLAEPLKKFLSGRVICSSARFETAVRDGRLVRLRFADDDRTASGLAVLDQAPRDDSPTLHCPPDPTLALLRSDVDDELVELSQRDTADVPSDVALSCTAYPDATRSARRVAVNKVRERLDSASRDGSTERMR